MAGPALQPVATFRTPRQGDPACALTLLGYRQCLDLVGCASPFVTKVEAFLRFGGLAYELRPCAPASTPKGKLPCVQHGGNTVPDSAFILRYIEGTYGAALYAPPSVLLELSPGQRAQAQALTALIEDHLLPIFAYFRWVLADEEALRRLARAVTRSDDGAQAIQARIQDRFIKQGLAAHSRTDLLTLAEGDVAALAETLGSKPYLLGERPCAADCSLFGLLDSVFNDTVCCADLKALFERHPSLRAFTDRVRGQFFADRLPGRARQGGE